MLILVTGGTGYIGSHTCVELLDSGYDVIILDNLANSEREVVDRIAQITGKRPLFYHADATDATAVDLIFRTHAIDGVIHFAGLKAVGESVEKPLAYYKNNLLSTMVVLENCVKYGVKRFVFSSSATVYGENEAPLVESMELRPRANPYGETKAMCEKILTDTARIHPKMSVALLRYFNPVGAHESGLIGEAPRGIPNNLMPYVTQVAKGLLPELKVFGNDYPTPDGTGVRDYIHVMDLVKGHLAALEKTGPGVHIYNLGTGKGTSVLELIAAFQRVNQVEIPYRIVERRPGDLAACWADASKARDELGWTAERSLEDMCRDAWRFERLRG
ncbi:MAG: UDP-glucose 4-epimerase GalE [Limnochordia bacterium]|jgi:UDP-glucose 4-epimerase|nr:UDP-glucose 4-epimerase GalE [Bacillota bacterium]HBG10104.1 UDP-glucose 4-epimerase GalE [Bacillota bacterium]